MNKSKEKSKLRIEIFESRAKKLLDSCAEQK
jgi:hypothetical protein